ncbi:MAG: 2-succinyl-5-enolpyruvyl-6-hydroxy-3-cyclohexene-carboxylic-acid synthase [Bacteroidota bacterium]|jgi:2-succinyl-5-enolpyruvyl-6-hydroxy-3-cyclohexene-1-carboxylate synthase
MQTREYPKLSYNLDYLTQLWEEAGILNWVVSPGSRNAPIVAALLKNKSFTLHSAPDERSGAFVALGIAQSNQFPAAFLCTSGTALVNAHSAVCEAYYQRIPLLIVSADRPEHLIDQWDGQTLRQSGIFGSYSRQSLHLNARNLQSTECASQVYELIQASLQPIPGPVHINIALDEPIYEGVADPRFTQSPVPPFVFQEFHQYQAPTLEKLQEIFDNLSVSTPKIAILIGHSTPNHPISEVLKRLQHTLPIFTDVCSHQCRFGLANWDWGLLKRDIPDNLKPDLLITLGTTVLSKPLKQKLKDWKPAHLHLGIYGEVGDPFQTQPLHWKGYESDQLETILIAIDQHPVWKNEVKDFKESWAQFIFQQSLTPQDLPKPFSFELEWIYHFLQQLNGETHIVQMGNSMPIRYASWSFPIKSPLYANRGVSGIDGSISTAFGTAYANPNKHVFAVVGDVSTIYDSNAFWMDFPSNLTVIVINNQGGRIFDWISGPNQFPPLAPFIHTPKSFDFSKIADFFQVPFCKLPIADFNNSVKSALAVSSGIVELM